MHCACLMPKKWFGFKNSTSAQRAAELPRRRRQDLAHCIHTLRTNYFCRCVCANPSSIKEKRKKTSTDMAYFIVCHTTFSTSRNSIRSTSAAAALNSFR